MLHCPQCGRSFPSDLTECPDDGALLGAEETAVSDKAKGPLAGRTLDEKYRLDERLGEGGMGTVYRATHLLIERPVAVKVLNARLVTDEAARERFRREARAAGRLQHTNAVAVTDFGETKDGLVYIVMELLEGHSLRDVVSREAPLDAARAVSLMLQISAAVAAAHEAGIIHRDLKPGNIFVVQRAHAPHIVKVLDFGIAKIAEDASEGNQQNTLTGTGMMIGTPRYMSPEQCDGSPLTPASDVYSLGVILYEMLTGRTPFAGATPLALAIKHSTETPLPLREIVPGVPEALEAVALHALEKDPRERPGDAGAFRRELYAVAEKLGLEHFASFGAPTIENLRDAGTETPSGRLVVDLERLRRQRAINTSEGPSLQDTGREDALSTGGNRIVTSSGQSSAEAFRNFESGSFGSEASAGLIAASQPSDASEKGYAGRRRRLHVEVPGEGGRGGDFSKFLQRPYALPLLALAALIVGGFAYLLLKSLANDGTGTNAASVAPSTAHAAAGENARREEAFGRTLSAPEDAERVRPIPEEPRTAGEFYERGAYYFSSRDFDRAERDYRRAIELQPVFPEAHNRLGRALMMQGSFRSAAREFREAIEESGGNYPAAQYNLGFALQQQGRYDEAISAYTDAIRSKGGEYPDAYFQIGRSHIARNRFAEAAEAFRRTIAQNNGRDPEAQDFLGVTLALQNDYAGAEAAFRAALEGRGGEYPEARFHLGTLYSETKRTAQAIREFEAYVQQEKDEKLRRRGDRILRELRRRLEREEAERRESPAP